MPGLPKRRYPTDAARRARRGPGQRRRDGFR